MNRRPFLLAVTFTASLCFAVGAVADWRRFRGPNGTGVAESPAPIKFGEKENLKWKLELPGRGVSSPIVVGDKVFVTCYSGYGMGDGDEGDIEDLKRHLVCVDRNSGKELWTKTVPAKMPEDPYRPPGVTSHGYASHTPVSDGERVYAFFGKSGVYAFDLDGNELWNQGVGTESARQRWGSAASPIVFEDFVIVNASDESEALVWLDKTTGEEKNRAEAAGLANSWSTPALVETDKGTELVILVPGEVWGFNASTGKLRWYSKGTSDNSLNSLLVGRDLVYALGGRGGEAVAVRPGGSGDVDASHIAWEGRAQGRYATPLMHEDHVFSVNGTVVTCHNAKTGERVYQKRLSSGQSVAESDAGGERRPGGGGGDRGDRGDRGERGDRRGGSGGGRGLGGRGGPGGGGFGGRGGPGGGRDYSSPVLAGGKIYIQTGAGTIYVIAASPEFELLETNDMTFDSSGFGGTPAISDGQLFLRSNTHLYCVDES